MMALDCQRNASSWWQHPWNRETWPTGWRLLLGSPEQFFWQPGALTRQFEQGVFSMVLCSKKTNVGSICADVINLLVFLHATQSTKQSMNEKWRRHEEACCRYNTPHMAITGYLATATCTVDEVDRTNRVVSRYC
jgi:hypothetical protein